MHSVDGYLDHFLFGTIKSKTRYTRSPPPFFFFSFTDIVISWLKEWNCWVIGIDVYLTSRKCVLSGEGILSSSHWRLRGLITPRLLSVLPICSTSVIVVGGKYYLVALICIPTMMTNDMSSFCVLIDHLGVSFCDVPVQVSRTVLLICARYLF